MTLHPDVIRSKIEAVHRAMSEFSDTVGRDTPVTQGQLVHLQMALMETAYLVSLVGYRQKAGFFQRFRVDAQIKETVARLVQRVALSSGATPPGD